MKQSTMTKLLLIGLLIVVATACSFAQNNSGFDTNINKTNKQLKQLDYRTIKLDLAIKVDNKDIYDTCYVLNIVNYNTGLLTTVKVSNKFVLYLEYNQEFEISVNYKGTNTKTIIVDTDSPVDNWYIISGIHLETTNSNRILAGGIRYDTKLQTFKKYK
jgi:hypothetical protein